MKKNTILGDKMGGYVMPIERSLDIAKIIKNYYLIIFFNKEATKVALKNPAPPVTNTFNIFYLFFFFYLEF